MTRVSVAAAVLAIGIPLVCHAAGDGKDDDAKKRQSSPAAKEAAKPPKATSTPEQQKAVLRDALKVIQSIGLRESKKDEEPPSGPFDLGQWKELQTDVVKEIGRAQARLGDLAGARSTWQSALDCVQETRPYQGPAPRANLYLGIATAQNEAGEQNEARFTLRQALQAARSIKSGASSPFDIDFIPQMETSRVAFSSNALATKAELLQRIAKLQTAAGEPVAAETTFQLSVETADSIDDVLNKVHALLAVAQGGPTEKVKPIWTKALDFAMAIKDEYPKAKAIEMVLRARIRARLVDQALATVGERLKGDLQSFSLWVVADAVASSEEKFAPGSMTRLYQLAAKAEFDRSSKKINVFRRIAEAQARLGDYEGAYRSAGEPHPINDVQTFLATQARMNVMKAVAEAQLKAKERDAARDTVLAAIELIGALPDEEAEAYFPLAELGSLQARSGDAAGAQQTALSLSSVAWRVHILGQVAEAHAAAGRRDLAQKAIVRALIEARGAPNQALWDEIAQVEGSSIYESTQDKEPMLPVLQTIATAQAKIGDLDAALKSVTTMGESSTAKWWRDTTLQQIAEARLEAGDTAGALRVADQTATPDPSGGSRGQLLEKIAKRQAADGDAAGALEWSGNQKTPDEKLHALRGLALGIVERLAAGDAKPSGAVTSSKAAE